MKKKILLLSVLSLLMINCTGCSSSGSKVSYSETFSVEDISVVNIDNDSWEVSVKQSDDEYVHVEATGSSSKENFNVSEGDGCLNIYQEDNGTGFTDNFSFGKSGEITISIPESMSGTLNIENESGNITMDHLVLDTLNVSNSDGGEVLTNLTIGNGCIDTDSGDITVKSSSLEELQVNSKSGGIYFTAVSGSESNIYSKSGEVVIKEATEKSYAQVETASSDISITYKVSPSSLGVEVSSGSEDVTVKLSNLDLTTDTAKKIAGNIGSAENYLSVKSDEGTITIK